MQQPRKNIGVRVDDYRADVKRGIQLAGAQAFTAVEIAADGAEVSPAALSETGRSHLARLVRTEGLSLSALALTCSGAGIGDPELVDRVVVDTAASLKMAADMAVPIVAHDVGELLALDETRRTTATDALRALAIEAERCGAIYAVRARTGTPEELRALVEAVACPLVRIAVDPGVLLAGGYDPLEALATFGDQVVHAYVRDATRGNAAHPGEETALGAGRLELAAYLAGLSAADYHAAPILRRTQSTSAADDVARDKAWLESRLLF